jgi:hypothetical protein
MIRASALFLLPLRLGALSLTLDFLRVYFFTNLWITPALRPKAENSRKPVTFPGFLSALAPPAN